MDRRDGYRVAIVGAGPRGTSVLERLLANQRLRAEWLAERLADLDRSELDILRTAIPLLTRVAAG